MATIDVKDAADVTVAIEKPLAPGRAASAASRPVVISNEDKAVLDAIAAQGNITFGAGAVDVTTPRVTLADDDPVAAAVQPNEYEAVAASQTAQVLGATGALGDYIDGLLIVPETTSPGSVTLIDNVTSIVVFAGGADSVGTLIPFFVPLGMVSASGAWAVTTGANVHVIGVGRFT